MTEELGRGPGSSDGDYEELGDALAVHRVIQPACNVVDEDRPSSACLMATPKDQGKLSVDRADYRQPRDSFDSFVKLGFAAVGTITVEHADCLELKLSRFHWPLPENAAHAFIDYRSLPRKDAEKVARKLFKRVWATCQGRWSYKFDAEEEN